MAYQKKSTSRSKKATKASEELEVVASAETPACCKDCDEKIEAVSQSVAALESKLKGILEGIEAASKLKAELDEAKLKLAAEVNELKEKAKSWKEKADTNNDGSLDWEELFRYVTERKSGRSPSRARKNAQK